MHKGCLICRNYRSKNLKASLMSLTSSLISDKARCFNQSEWALYDNLSLSRVLHCDKIRQTFENTREIAARVFYIFNFECSEMAGVFYHSVIHG